MNGPGSSPSNAPETAPPAPQPIAFGPPFWDEPVVQRFGRTFPRASVPERVAWGFVFLGLCWVLWLASQLTPDPTGMGTHQQVVIFGYKLEPCGFAVWTGHPCPSCGMTTTFALAAHGHLLAAAKNQPFGFIVFMMSCVGVPIAALGSFGAVSWARRTDHWNWLRIVVVLIAMWLTAWVYKMKVQG